MMNLNEKLRLYATKIENDSSGYSPNIFRTVSPNEEGNGLPFSYIFSSNKNEEIIYEVFFPGMERGEYFGVNVSSEFLSDLIAAFVSGNYTYRQKGKFIKVYCLEIASAKFGLQRIVLDSPKKIKHLLSNKTNTYKGIAYLPSKK